MRMAPIDKNDSIVGGIHFSGTSYVCKRTQLLGTNSGDVLKL